MRLARGAVPLRSSRVRAGLAGDAAVTVAAAASGDGGTDDAAAVGTTAAANVASLRLFFVARIFAVVFFRAITLCCLRPLCRFCLRVSIAD